MAYTRNFHQNFTIRVYADERQVLSVDEVISILTDAVAGGPVSWEAFRDSVPQHLRRHLMSAVRQLEADGVLHRHIDGTVAPPVFTVRPGAPVVE